MYWPSRFGHNAGLCRFHRLDALTGSRIMDGRRKNYRAWDPQQNGHDSISPRQALPEDDLVFFLLDLIPQIDLTPFHEYYVPEMRGQPPFDVTMMVTLLVYAYSVGARSSRKIA